MKNKSLDLSKSRYIAIGWFEDFLKFLNEDLLKETAANINEDDDTFFYKSQHSSPRDGSEIGKIEEDKEEIINQAQQGIMHKLRSSIFPDMLKSILYYINTENTDLQQKLGKINTSLQKLVIRVLKNNEDLEQITICLKVNFDKGKVKTKEIAIEWFTELFKHYSDKLLSKDDQILTNIINNVNFKDSKLAESVLKLLCLMSSKYHQFLKDIIQKLLERFKQDKDISSENINKLLHIMCSNIDKKLVFSEFAIELRQFDEYDFVSQMVNTLDLILAGAAFYKPLRDILSRSNEDDEK